MTVLYPPGKQYTYDFCMFQIFTVLQCWYVIRCVHYSNHGSRRENQMSTTGKYGARQILHIY